MPPSNLPKAQAATLARPGASTLPLAPTRGASGIAAQLRRAITDELYGYGDRLPPEREIARSFGASRTTVRKALYQLEEDKFVERKIGSGTYVVYGPRAKDQQIADITSPLELMEVRLAIEPHIIRLALLHGTSRDIEAIGEALAGLERAGDDRERFTNCDEQFHLALAAATHNPLIVWIYRQINDVRAHKQWSKAKDKVLTASRIGSYNLQHRALFEAVQARDIKTALELIGRHLDEARRDLLGAPAT